MISTLQTIAALAIVALAAILLARSWFEEAIAVGLRQRGLRRGQPRGEEAPGEVETVGGSSPTGLRSRCCGLWHRTSTFADWQYRERGDHTQPTCTEKCQAVAACDRA